MKPSICGTSSLSLESIILVEAHMLWVCYVEARLLAHIIITDDLWLFMDLLLTPTIYGPLIVNRNLRIIHCFIHPSNYSYEYKKKSYWSYVHQLGYLRGPTLRTSSISTDDDFDISFWVFSKRSLFVEMWGYPGADRQCGSGDNRRYVEMNIYI